MTGTAFLRARRPEHKQQRREAILTAARDLAHTSGVRNVSLGAVADAVGLAKSNIQRYFGTREEIYLELLTEEWRQWAQTVSTRLRDTHGTAGAIAALAGTLYRAANPSPALAQVYAEDPELATSHPALLPTLVRTLSALAAGLPTLRDKERR